MTGRYWAISGIGWGRGETPDEAETNYYEAQARNFRHLHRTKQGRIKQIRDLAPPDIWLAPEGVTGFHISGNLFWERDGHAPVVAEDSQVVRPAQKEG